MRFAKVSRFAWIVNRVEGRGFNSNSHIRRGCTYGRLRQRQRDSDHPTEPSTLYPLNTSNFVVMQDVSN
jgi:hypothetical protein